MERGFSWLSVTENRKIGFPRVGDVTADPIVPEKKKIASPEFTVVRGKVKHN